MKEQAKLNIPGRNDPCWCGSGRKYKKCHLGKGAPGAATGPVAAAKVSPAASDAPRATALFNKPRERGTLIKSAEQIAGIRAAGKLTAQLLDMLEERIEPGITTNDIDLWVHEITLDQGATSAPLNYKGFPKSVCTSINEVVCHGIPGERVLQEGDIINVDVSPKLNGYYGDSSRMYCVGKVSPEAEKLVRVTRECLDKGIAQVRPGGFVGDIGHAIQTHAEKHGYSVVREFVGHGTGVRFHEDPQIPHFGRPGKGPPLREGMVFTIEPMINVGDWPVKILDDDWTAITADGSLSAQWEHTLLVTGRGYEILTLS